MLSMKLRYSLLAQVAKVNDLSSSQIYLGVTLIDLEESVERTSFGLERGGELPTKER